MRTLMLAVLAAILSTGAAFAEDVGDQLTALVGKYAPSIVTVKLVLKSEVTVGGQTRDNESRLERHGVVVDPAGLVMLGSAGLTGDTQSASFGGGNDVQVKITATDIKVVVGREDKEFNAFVAATDSKVGLAFLQIEELGDRKLAAIDFGASADTAMGQMVATVGRQTKGYDYAPYFETARVNGDVEKPRKAWMMEGRMGAAGLPVFKFTGQVVGVLTAIPDPTRSEEQAGGGGRGGRGGRGGGRLQGLVGGGGGEFILPGSVVQALIAQAKTKAVEVAAERAKQKAEEAKTEGKKSEPADKDEAGKKTDEPK